MLTIIIGTGLLCGNAYALYRRPDWVAGGLLVLFCIGTVMQWTQPLERLPGVLAFLDALVSLTMLFVWAQMHDQRARVVGFVSLLKCVWALLFYTNSPPWLFYATVLNTAFIFQLVVAGGFADGLVAWIDRIYPGVIRQRHRRRDQLG